MKKEVAIVKKEDKKVVSKLAKPSLKPKQDTAEVDKSLFTESEINQDESKQELE